MHVVRNVLCMDLPDPDGLEIPELPAPKPGQTTRERYAAHAQGACAACHIKIDGVGFAFENYDATGGFRTTEAGQAGRFQRHGGAALGRHQVRQGASTSSRRWPAPRSCATAWPGSGCATSCAGQEVPEEAGSVEALATAFESSGWDVRELLVALTKTRAFTHRKPGDDEGI